MSQFGMQMPGGKPSRSSAPDVYTAMMVVATIALAAACAVVGLAGSKVGKDGNVFQVQDAGHIRLPQK